MSSQLLDFYKKVRLIFLEFIIFLLIQVFGLLTGWRMSNLPQWHQTFNFPSYNLSGFFIGFVLALLFILVFLKVFKKYNLPFRLFFYFLVFSTSLIVFSVWLPEFLVLGLIITLFLIFHFWPNVLVHNFLIGITCTGAALFLGLGFQPKQLIVLLVILAIYDIVAVFVTSHMIKMFKEMVAHKLILAFIIPIKDKDWLSRLSSVQIGSGFIFLGTGDLVLPMAFAISAFRYGLLTSIFVILGSLIGLIILAWYFLSQKERRPLPALPPIVAGALFGYLISFIISK